MKVNIESVSQGEFDKKRPELIKAIAGSQYEVALRKKGQATTKSPRKPFFKAQAQMLKYWDTRYKAAVKDIKEQVLEILNEK